MTNSAPNDAASEPKAERRHFIQQLIDRHIAEGRWGEPGDATAVVTRFPPEPNGFLHIGHAKAVCVSFGLAESYGGRCFLRFDDTNPAKEEQAFVDSIVRDIRWLGYRWDGADDADPMRGVLFASDYFEQMHAWAVELIEKGLAYVDTQDPETIRRQRGSVTRPGEASPFRDRPAEESLGLFAEMVGGGLGDGAAVLRAKIDMASPNMNLRDPVMYRVVNATHHRTGDRWHVYPMYDWAHGLEDSIEGVTNSLCTLEFENHRPLYDWFIDAINRDRPEPIHHPQQTEFARLNPSYIVTSKRKLKQLVDEGRVSGWDDPRMPTLSGLRRLGYTPEAIRNFCQGVGVTKFNAVHDIGLLENAVREHLNKAAPRRMAVLDPVKVVVTNWEASKTDWLDAVNNPEDDAAGKRQIPFTRELWIEREDFMADPPRKFFRLGPGREVRLRYGYWITCTGFETDDAGRVTEIHATHDPQTRGGDSPPPDAEDNVRKVKGTLHWVSAEHAVDAEVRLFDRLFSVERPDKEPKDAAEGWSFLENLNPESLKVVAGAKLEPALAEHARQAAEAGRFHSELGDLGPVFQFERLGYFCVDPDSTQDSLVFNRTVSLRDSWAKQNK
ncbi:MAG: glutamine--tRNA ligase/YqeY domain fusion protein [Planctomycetota bacterium]